MRIRLGFSTLLTIGVMPVTARAATAIDLGRAPAVLVTKTDSTTVRIAGDFRLRADIETSSVRIDPFGDPDRPMRHRFASSMIDYYPLGGASGFRLTAGLRFFEVQNFYGDAVWATGGLLWEPRVTGRNAGVRTGFERRTPAATIGYAATVEKATVGVEIGSLLGTANARMPSSFGRGRFGRRGGLNPIANLNVALKF